jgi:hypothetical protein
LSVAWRGSGQGEDIGSARRRKEWFVKPDQSHSTAPPQDGSQRSAPLRDGALRERAQRVEKEIADLYFRLLESRKLAAGERFPSTKATLRLAIDVHPPGAEPPGPAPPGSAEAGSVGLGPETRSGQLYQELVRVAERCVAERAPFPMGRVHCHWCRSNDCVHASPPDSRSVFCGYTATGQPVWQELISVLLERRHPQIDAVLGSDPSPVALVQRGHELSAEQLPVYGKRSPIYQILAQVILGYVPFPESARGASDGRRAQAPVALTFQAVVAGESGRPPVLNILGRLPDGTPAYEALEESPDDRIADALRGVRRSLDELTFVRANVRRRKQLGEKKQRAVSILTRLARNLERIFRQRSRRTFHANGRHQDRKRPASSALRDALDAHSDSIFRDVEERTWVIVGPKSRVHVFNDAALHVTSVVYPGETVRQRTTRGKWLAPRREELAAFRKALEERVRVER